MDPPQDLRVGWDKMISRELQLEMWKTNNEGVRKSLDNLARRYASPGDEWRRYLPSTTLSTDRGSQTDATDLRPIAALDDELQRLRQESEKLRDAIRRQELYYEAELKKVASTIRAEAQSQFRSLEQDMEERVRTVRAAHRMKLRNEIAKAKAELQKQAVGNTLTEQAEQQVEEEIVGVTADQSVSQSSAAGAISSQSRESWTQEREELLHEAAWRLQRQTTTLQRMAERITDLEEQLAVAKIKEEGVRLDEQRRGKAVLSSAEAELRIEAVRRYAQKLEMELQERREEAEQATAEVSELRIRLALLEGCAALRGLAPKVAEHAKEDSSSERDAERPGQPQEANDDLIVTNYEETESGYHLSGGDRSGYDVNRWKAGREAFKYFRQMARRSTRRLREITQPSTPRLTSWSRLAKSSEYSNVTSHRALEDHSGRRGLSNAPITPLRTTVSADSLEQIPESDEARKQAPEQETLRELDQLHQTWEAARRHTPPERLSPAAEGTSSQICGIPKRVLRHHIRNINKALLYSGSVASVTTKGDFKRTSRFSHSADSGETEGSAASDDDNDVVVEVSSKRRNSRKVTDSSRLPSRKQSRYSSFGKDDFEHDIIPERLKGSYSYREGAVGLQSRVVGNVGEGTLQSGREGYSEYLVIDRAGEPNEEEVPVTRSHKVHQSNVDNSSEQLPKRDDRRYYDSAVGKLNPEGLDRKGADNDTSRSETTTRFDSVNDRAMKEANKIKESYEPKSLTLFQTQSRTKIVSRQPQLRKNESKTSTTSNKTTSSTSRSDESGEPEPKPTSGDYYERMAQRMERVASAPTTSRGEVGRWTSARWLRELGGSDVDAAPRPRRRWRRRGPVSLSAQNASDLEDIDRRRQQRQLFNLEPSVTQQSP